MRNAVTDGGGRQTTTALASEGSPSCDTCFWWRVIQGSDGEYGTCHAYAPRAVLDTVKRARELEVVWPPTFAWEHCGEFRPMGRDPEEVTS